MNKTPMRLAIAAALAAGLTAPAMAVSLGTIQLGDSKAHTFTRNPGVFTDFLSFRLGNGATGIGTTVVSLDLSILNSSFYGISNFAGRLYEGNLNSVPATPAIGPLLTSGNSTNVSFGPLNSGQFYTFVYTGNATGSNGGIYTAAVAAVPEAHEWAMMLSGLGLLAFVVSGRRKSAALAAA